MDYKKFLKTMSTVLVYILVAGGALIMIMPFAWMVMTSLKTDSEVAAWPPNWTTKNFKSERDVNVNLISSLGGSRGTLSLAEFRALSTQQSFNPNLLVFFINDDHLERGTVTLKYSDFRFSDKNNLDEMFEFIFGYINNVSLRNDFLGLFTSFDKTPRNFEQIYFNLFAQEDGYFKKTILGRSLRDDLNGIINYIDTTTETNIDRLPAFRIMPTMNDEQISEIESKKDEFINYLKTLKILTNELIQKVEPYSRGLGLLSLETANALINDHNDFLNEIIIFEDSILSRTNTLIQRNVYEVVEKNLNTLSFYVNYFDNIDNFKNIFLDEATIVFNIPTKDEMYENLINDLPNSKLNFHQTERVKKLLTKKNVLEISEIVVHSFESDINEAIRTGFDIERRDVATIISIVRTLARNNATLENAQNFISARNYELLINSINTKEDVFLEILQKRVELDNFINYFNNFFNNSISRAQIIESPDFIESIRFKNKNRIEIHTKDILTGWILDEVPQVSSTFKKTSIFKNIFQNYVDAWNAAPFSRYYLNTTFMAVITTLIQAIIGSMAAFAFAKLNFWGKNLLFTLLLATMMVPGEVLLVPNYIMISRFQWLDTYYALIVPWVISVFAVFLLRQQFMTVPHDLWDAAKIDGSSSWRFLWTVMVPLSKPALLTGSLLKFVGSWNAFLWVLIVTREPEMRTLAVGLQTFRSESGDIYNQLMAASTFSIIPVIIIFIFLQKYFVEGIAKTGLKG